MASSPLLRVLISRILLAIKCEFSNAQQEEATSHSASAILLYQIIGDLYKLQNENKMMAEKIEMLEEKMESMENSAEGKVK